MEIMTVAFFISRTPLIILLENWVITVYEEMVIPVIFIKFITHNSVMPGK